MAGALCLAPVIYPWHVVWFMPFLVLRAIPALWVWSLTILSVYPVWHLAAQGGTFEVPPALLAVEFGVPLLTMGAMSAEARWRSRP